MIKIWEKDGATFYQERHITAVVHCINGVWTYAINDGNSTIHPVKGGCDSKEDAVERVTKYINYQFYNE